VTDGAAQVETLKADEVAGDISTASWRQALFYLAAAALLFRFYDLPLKPLHHDEGVNTLFLSALVQPPHVFEYDPANYHGPTLYYFGWLGAMGLGLSTVAARGVTAVAGMLAIAGLLSLRRTIGGTAALAGATFFALSPGAVYFSRYFIHEMLLVCFSLWAVVFAVAGSPRRRTLHLAGAAAAAGLAFATKETSIITAAVVAIAAVSSHVLLRLHRPMVGDETTSAPVRLWRAIGGAVGDVAAGLLARQARTRLGIIVLVFVTVNVLFYSSFFTHWPGVVDAVRSLAIWSGTGTTAHVHPWHTYLRWLAAEELPLLLVGGIGVVHAIWAPPNRFLAFSALWAVGMVTAYSLIPYKTPWLVLNMLAPLAICAGHACQRAWSAGRRARLVVAAAVLVAWSASAAQAFILNFREYDDDRHPYVYVHTSRELLSLVERVGALQAARGPSTIAVTSPDHFPLSWYLRQYRVGFYGKPVATGDPIVIASEDQPSVLEPLLGHEYERIGMYVLRPGVRLILYARRGPRSLAPERP
jgi:uncharacterized protein (TIGR03663 family)